jgi:sugar lactone lactonase YvrE
VLPIDGLDVPRAIDVADDGRLAVAAVNTLAIVDGDGGRADVALPPNSTIDAIAWDTSGVLFATDEENGRVLRLEADGSWTDVDLATPGTFRGLAIDDDDALYVLDLDTDDVIRRATDGTEGPVGFVGLDDPVALDVAGDRIAVVQPSRVVVREGDGTEGSPTGLEAGNPQDIDLADDGTLLVGYYPSDGGRSGPPAPGALLRLPAGGAVERVTFGDLGSFASVAAAGPATVLYGSWAGAPGYSDANPLRRVVGDGPPSDVGPADGLLEVDAANDGTAYRSDGRRLVRVAPGGTATDVALPTEPGKDAVDGLSVDEQGRLFVALSSGYGTGAFEIVEPLAPGGPKTWYASDGSSEQLQAFAASAGVVQLVTYGTPGPQRLLAVRADGSVEERATLGEAPVDAMDVDAGGNAYLVSFPGNRGAITVVSPAGATSALAYQGQTFPRALSMGADGTLYVGDDLLGLIALDDVGAEAAPAPPPGTPPPATPVPASPTFTG